jgi:phage-related protein (TIGR01555 family)
MSENNGLKRAKFRAANELRSASKYDYPVVPPSLAAGVAPADRTAPVLAADSNCYSYLSQSAGGGFAGFPHLAQLSTRTEYRGFASAMSTEITRAWIELTSSKTDGSSVEKLKMLATELERIKLRNAIGLAVMHDCFFGRAQILIKIKGADDKTPLILSDKTIGINSLDGLSVVEAVWTTPSNYNAIDPSAPNFYRPSSWFMLGREVHASRLMTIVTRPVSDLLKPAFNFAGVSLSQLAEPYVDNWLRTRQAVSDLVNNFSITTLATDMSQLLSGEDDGTSVFDRADFFTATRSNRGLMLLDKEREEIQQVNTPLGGLSELQAQAQEHMCSASRLPAIILTGISPSGLNATSEGEIRVFYDWIAAQQEAYWREPIETVLKVAQLSLFGEIDSDISFAFNSLHQQTPEQQAAIREADQRTDTGYIASGVLDPAEVRARLAHDKESGHHGIDVEAVMSYGDE